jgi:hypothetical protein
MAVTKPQLYSYCRPMLARNSFDFTKLSGLVDKRALRMLPLAQSLAVPGRNDASFRASLSELAPDMYLNGRVSPELHSALRRRLVNNGLFSSYGQDDSAGMIISSSMAGETGIHLLLGTPRKDKTTLRESSSYFDILTDPLLITVFLEGIGARTVELLDIAFSDRDSDELDIDKQLMTMDIKSLKAFCGRVRIPKADVPIELATLVVGVREALHRIDRAMQDSESPGIAIMDLLNERVQYCVTYQVAKHQFRQSVPKLAEDPKELSLCSHLAAGVYHVMWPAVLSMLHERITIQDALPAIASEMQGQEAQSFTMRCDYLQEHAKTNLDNRCKSVSGGKGHEDVLYIEQLKRAGSTQLVLPMHMPLVETVLYNPGR